MNRAASIAATMLVAACSGACAAPAIRSTLDGPPTRQQLSELWVDPAGTPRNLAAGPGDHRPPEPEAPYQVLERDTGGFSITYVVRDGDGVEWNVKIGPEAQTEVVASRILWALGYHQPPSYFVERWVAVSDTRRQLLGGARFRPKNDGLDGKGPWSWHQNPFVGTRQYNGLLSLLMLINSTDLKADNNELYEVKNARGDRPRRLYVVKDVGASLGETGRVDPRRNFIDGFEREPFLTGRNGQWARFAFRGRHQALVDRIPVADLKWMCERVLALNDRQWRDMFGAARYDEQTTSRYIARIRAKAREGAALQ